MDLYLKLKKNKKIEDLNLVIPPKSLQKFLDKKSVIMEHGLIKINEKRNKK